jgi:hypothetical protein
MTKTKLIPTLLTLSLFLCTKIIHSANPTVGVAYYALQEGPVHMTIKPLTIYKAPDNENGEECVCLVKRLDIGDPHDLGLVVRKKDLKIGAILGIQENKFKLIKGPKNQGSSKYQVCIPEPLRENDYK